MITQINSKTERRVVKDSLTERIISCCFNIHTELGPGFNERIYHEALKITLSEAGLEWGTERKFKVLYRNHQVGVLRLDLVVEDKVVVEIKAITGNMPDVFKFQLLSYLKVSRLKVGLLVNFGNKSCQVRRFVS